MPLKDEIKLADLGSCRGIYSRQPQLARSRYSGFQVANGGFQVALPRFLARFGARPAFSGGPEVYGIHLHQADVLLSLLKSSIGGIGRPSAC